MIKGDEGNDVHPHGKAGTSWDARSIREGLWRMAHLTQEAAEKLDAKIEDEDLDGRTEAVEVREALERLQALSLEMSEELDAYQQRHGS